MGTVRVAIVGVGNCAAALVQGVEYYRDADPAARVPGLMHVELGDYHVGDIEFVAAFDVDGKKVGRDLSEASSPARTTPSSSPTYRHWASRCSGATPSTPSGGTSANLMVLFSLATMASDRSRPTFLPSTSKAATNSMSPTW